MGNAKYKLRSSVLPSPAVLARRIFLRHACRVIFLIGVLCASVMAQAGDAYDAALDRRFAEPKGSTNEMRAATGAVDPAATAIEHALKAEQQRRSQGPPEPPPAPLMGRTGLILLAVSPLVLILASLKIIKVLNDRLTEATVISQEAAERALRDQQILEEPSMASFFLALRQGLEPSGEAAVVGIPLSHKELGVPLSQDEQARQLQEFFDVAPGQIAAMRAQIAKITHTPGNIDVELRRKFYRQIDALKQKSGMSALRSVWLVLCGLEGLMHQLSKDTANSDASVLRTIKGAVDLLGTLCVPGSDPALATRMPVEILAVDDNSVCLTAVSMALRKAFRKPDVAAEGLSALAMAEKKHYDVIFLDVEMPGMDGFELCSKIRDTDLNRTTPVVFVTRHGDFESRGKSAVVGAQELIAKPFHSFEITVKALTLALRGRLEADAVAVQPAAKAARDSVDSSVLRCISSSPLPAEG
jgi:CheY-like chemotaxis protein